jgi:hypothetical protein
MADAKKQAVAKVITGGKITPQKVGAITSPVLTFQGEKPTEGSEIEFKLDNGVIYLGTVKEAVADKDEIMVVFEKGISPK